MKLRSLVAGAAILALCAGAAQAATHHHHYRHAKAWGKYAAFAPPAQPVAYSKLDDYLKASPGLKRAGNWGLDTSMAAQAATGTGANVSANAPAGENAAPAATKTPPPSSGGPQ